MPGTQRTSSHLADNQQNRSVDQQTREAIIDGAVSYVALAVLQSSRNAYRK